MSIKYLIADSTTGAILASGWADTAEDVAVQVLGVPGDLYTHDGPAQLDDTRLEVVAGELVRKSGVSDGFDPSATTMETVE